MRFISGRCVQPADRAATDGKSVRPRDYERTQPWRQMLRLEVRPKPLVGRVLTGQVLVEGRNEPSRIG